MAPCGPNPGNQKEFALLGPEPRPGELRSRDMTKVFPSSAIRRFRPKDADLRQFVRASPAGTARYGSCSVRTLFGRVLPTFTRMGSRSFPVPVYFTWPFMFTSRVE